MTWLLLMTLFAYLTPVELSCIELRSCTQHGVSCSLHMLFASVGTELPSPVIFRLYRQS